MRANRQIRTAGAWGHLLLIAVLALGIFAMHTLGHPPGHSAEHSAASAAPMGTTTHAPGTHSPDHATRHHHGTPSPHHAPGTGMDMTSLCLAVLGTWVLAGLLYLALRRRSDWLVPLRAGALAALRPNPPPRPPDLARLSVLRI